MIFRSRWPVRVALLVVVVAAPGVAGAQDAPSPSAGPVARPAAPASLGDEADAVLRAWDAMDAAALAAAAANDDPDPWLVADELLRRERFDAAEAFAKAAPRKTVERLPDYVAARRDRPEDAERRARLAEGNAALGANRWADALRALGPNGTGAPEDVVGVRLLMGRALALRGLVRADEATAAFLDAGAAAERLGWLRRAQRCFDEAGQTAYRASDFRGALRAWQRTLAACEQEGDRARALAPLGNIGVAHAAMGDRAKALEVYTRVLAAAEELGERRVAATTLGSLGVLHYRGGDYAQALALCERALAAKQALGDEVGAAATLGNIGDILAARGEYPKALATYERALAAKEALGDRRGAAATLGNIASVHASRGEPTRALAIFERVLADAEARGDPGEVAGALGNLGNVHASLGDYARALATLERALEAKEALGDRAGASMTLGNLGNVHAALGDYARALTLQRRALATKEAMGDEPGVATTLGNIGNLYAALGDDAQALATYERALAAQEALGDRPGAARTLVNVGSTYFRLGEVDKAQATHDRALAALEALGNQVGVAVTLGHVAADRRAQGDAKGARAAAERGVRLARSLRAQPLLVALLRFLAELHLEAGASGRALGAAREALLASETLLGGLGEEQGAQARAKQAGLYEVGALAAAREEDASEVCSFLESGRAGALLDALDKRETLRWKAEALSEDLKAADARASAAEREARAAYERALQGDDRRAATDAARALDDALEQVRDVSARIQRETKRAAGLFYPRARSIEQIQASLEPGDALVLYGLCLGEAVALVVEPEGERLVALGSRQSVERACDTLALRDRGDDPTEALSTLGRLLVEPLALGEGVRHVLVSPDGPLCFLPWGALFDRAVAVTPSGSTHALLREEERAPGVGVLALGDPDYVGAEKGAQAIYFRGRTLSPLPATRTEAQAVGTVTLLGAQATEDGFRAALPRQSRWRAVHLACHGLIDARRPGLSSLALSGAPGQDGFLTALEVLRMQVPADLAVLSACETATGRLEGGEGIVGLTRAFMYAGTPRVLCSLWKVDDEATSALMRKFYELWNPRTGSTGMGTAEALRAAQEHVKSQAKWKHPYYWAAWVLWGLPS